ncbi:MAG: HAMP domain-containing protein, partial [Clostridiaceae bacterium]|nr:HAMP domain-containing protein [Clostridiaceae bacterium]
MLKKISIRIKLLIMVNAIITPIAILRILYLLISHNNTLIKDFGFSEVSITGIHSRIIKEELIILGIILLLTSISTLHFTGYFLKPVKLLQNTAKRIMEGDYSARTNIKSNDEIG